MAQFPNIFNCDLHSGPVSASIRQMYLGDIAANRVGVRVTDNGEAVVLSGTCSGTAMLYNGGTVALTGVVDGNVAYVDLPAAVYSVEGPLKVFVTLTHGGSTTTLLEMRSNVTRTESGVVIDPGTIIPSVAALISDIEDAVASIPEDYSELSADVVQLKSDMAEVKPEVETLGEDVSSLKSATSALFDMEDYSLNVYFTMTDGEIHSGTQQADARRCYSDMIENVMGLNIYFDDTKYKALLVYFNADQTDHTYDSWVSSSPATSAVNPNNYSKVCIELQTKNDSNINKADAQSSTYYVRDFENKIKRAFGTVYVDGYSGSDNNDGSANSPYKTIERAISSGAGEILVYTQNYAYDTPIVLSNISNLRIAPVITSYFPAYGTDTPKITVSGGASYSFDHAIEMTNCHDITLEGFDCYYAKEAIVKIENCFNFKIVDCDFHANVNSGGGNTRDGLQIENGSGVVMNCRAWNIGRDGFNIHGYGCTRFIDCVAHDCGDDGISHHDACTGTISGGEYYNCGKGGVSSPTHGSYIDVDGVYSHDNAYGLYAVTADETVRRRVKGIIRNCVFKDNSSYDIAIISGDLIGIQNIYDTKSISISTQATFTEYN